MAEVKIIEAKLKIPKLVRVAAYTRVSSEKDAMLHSLANQVSFFSKFIQANDIWTYVGVYSDEAKTGTKDDRPGFQKLIEDAKAGKIDIILTKSVSRFARNTVTLLKTIRELKDIGVDVYFDEQKIHTNSNEGELLLSILASYAQEESRATSENTLWRVRKNFQEGKLYGGGDCYGYKVENGKFTIVPEQAVIVRRIFDLYLEGYGCTKIAKILCDNNIPSMLGGLWNYSSVYRIIKNENYTGDLILQKTYRENHLTKKKRMNNGEKAFYINEDDHEPIITREIFNKAQEILNKRKFIQGPTNKHLFARLLVCGECGKTYKFKKTKYNPKYECTTYNSLGKKYCSSKGISEEEIIARTKEILGVDEIDDAFVLEMIESIVIHANGTLEYRMRNGDIKTTTWQVRSRRNSWTPEMKEQARQKALKQNRRGV